MCLLYLKVICARPWGPKEAFGYLKSPKTPLLTASFLRPIDTEHTVYRDICRQQLENCHLNAIDLGSQYECTGSVWIPKIVKPDPPRATHLMGSRLQGERPDRCWQGQSQNSDFEHGGLPCVIPFAVHIDLGHLPDTQGYLGLLPAPCNPTQGF